MALLRPDGKTANDPLGSALPVDAKQLPWFMAEVPEPPEEFRDILEANGIAPSEARQHIQSVVCTYPRLASLFSSVSSLQASNLC